MHLAATYFPTDYAISPADLAVALEERGFESLWVAEHSHIPASRATPYPGGGELPKMYYDAMDPFVSLATAAPVTRRLKLATGICLVVQRDPIQTAKQVASLDQLSGGRFLFGVGAGWNREEMADHGTTDFAGRFALLRERIEAMKAIWTQKEASYRGERVSFDPLFAWPKPVQKPHPPIHVGGGFPGAARRAVRYGDGWMPIHGRDHEIASQAAALKRMAAEAGRDPDALEVSVFGCPPEPDAVARYRDVGIARVVFFLPSQDRDAVLPRLDRMAALVPGATAG